VYLICCGYNDRITEERKQTRALMFTMYRLMGDGKIGSPEEFWPLPGDEDQAKREEMSQEEIRRQLDFMASQGHKFS